MPFNKSQKMVSLFGGALAGAAAMYLLDPDLGAKRRKAMKRQAEGYLDEAGQWVHGGMDKVGGGLRDVGHTLAEKTEDYGRHISELAHQVSEHLADRAAEARSQAADTIDDWRSQGRQWWKWGAGKARKAVASAHEAADSSSQVSDRVARYGNRLWGQVRGLGDKLSQRTRDAMKDAVPVSVWRREPRSAAMPVAITAIGCCAAGAALMYLMDPRQGRSRREKIVGQVTTAAQRTGRTFNKAGRQIANRFRGGGEEESEHRDSGGPVASEELLNRVREQIAKAATQPRLVRAMADGNGAVTLSGEALAEEIKPLIASVESARGVSVVINRLQIRQPAGNNNPARALDAGENATAIESMRILYETRASMAAEAAMPG